MKGQLSEADKLRQDRAKIAWQLIAGGNESRISLYRQIIRYTREIERLEGKK